MTLTSRTAFCQAPSSRGCPTRQAATLRDRLAPPASSELPALSRALRASAPALRAAALLAPRVPAPHPAVASTWKLLSSGGHFYPRPPTQTPSHDRRRSLACWLWDA